MSDVAIRVENLSKLYRIGAREEQPRGLGQTVRSLVASPFAYLQRSRRPPTEEETLWALRDVSFEVKQGEVIGIIGRNGAGKSTLLKILSRITEPSGGEAHVFGRVGSLLEVGTGFHPELTGRENIYLNGTIMGMKRAEIDRKFDEIIAFSEVEKFLDTPVKRYSSGMYVRLAFAVAAHLEPEILLVDEVLAVGDIAFQKKCLGKMEDVAREGRTVLFISHNMSAISALCAKGMLLQSGNLAYVGDTQTVVQLYISNSNNALGADLVLKPTCDLLTSSRRFSSSLAILVRATVLNADGELCTTFHFGDTLRLCLEFEVSQPIRVAVEVLLKSSLAQNITLFASGHFQNLILHAQPHQINTVELIIPHLSLARGRYGLDAGLTIPFAEWLDYVEDACVFDVETSDPGGTGFSFEQSYGFGSTYIHHLWRD